MKSKKTLVLVLVAALLVSVMGIGASASESETVKLGFISTITGSNALNGEYALNGFLLAVEEINAAGGILGKEVTYSIADEMSTTEGSVNALAKLLEDEEIMAVCGSHMSVYAIAGMQEITASGTPYVSNGSSSSVEAEGNPLVWQSRPLDIYQGVAMAEYAINVHNVQNPAILYSTDSTFVNIMEQTVKAFSERGIEIPEENLFAYAESESNFSNYIAQIMAGDFDCLILDTSQTSTILILQQAQAAGLDMLGIGFNSIADANVLENAASAAEGWYSISDWCPAVDTQKGSAFAAAYEEKYGNLPATSGAYAYDAVYLIKAAMEAAGTTEDKAAINEGFKQIKDLEGATTTFSYFTENQSLASSLFVAQVSDGVALCVDVVKYR